MKKRKTLRYTLRFSNNLFLLSIYYIPRSTLTLVGQSRVVKKNNSKQNLNLLYYTVLNGPTTIKDKLYFQF